MRTLHELLRQTGATVTNDRDPVIAGVTCDSRRVGEGFLFVAVKGRSTSGAAHLGQALDLGAAAVASAEPLALPEGVAAVRLDDDRRGAAELAAAWHGFPSRALRVVGVTGTNGKTTTTWMLEAVLSARGRCGLIGTIRRSTGASDHRAAMTTPAAEDLQADLAEMRDAGCTHAVMEVSSHALDQHRVAGIDFDVAVVTNVTRDHLDYHGDLGAYQDAKARLFGHLAAEASVVLNADDECFEAMRRRVPASARVITCSTTDGAPADVRGRLLHATAREMRYAVAHGDREIEGRARLVGRHNLDNLIAALAAAQALGVDLAEAAARIESLAGVPGRLEPVDVDGAFEVLVDYAHTPDALDRVLAALRPITAGRLLCLFGCGGDRDRGKRPLMGGIAEAGADVVVLTADNPRGEDVSRIIDDIRSGMREPAAAVVIEDRAAAIEHVLGEARPGDVVLLTGKGHEDYQILPQGRLDHDDRAVVRQWNDRRRERPTEEE